MSADNDLLHLADQIKNLRSKFVDSGSVKFLPSEDQAEFKRVAVEAKTILDEALGMLNNFSSNLLTAVNVESAGMWKPTYERVSDTEALIRGAVNHLRRQPIPRGSEFGSSKSKPPYVDSTRLAAIHAVRSTEWDLARLAQLCFELNIAHENECHMTVAMLVHAIVDHVPPIFGQTTFDGVANNYAGARSFKQSMQNLNRSLRNIADAHLHIQVRQKESVPTEAQVRFGTDLDVLLAEVVRLVTGPRS